MLQRLEVIDFLRGFSIFTIVLMHLLQSFPISPFLMAASSFGGAGVHVFILCSGFGLYLSYLNRPTAYLYSIFETTFFESLFAVHNNYIDKCSDSFL